MGGAGKKLDELAARAQERTRIAKHVRAVTRAAITKAANEGEISLVTSMGSLMLTLVLNGDCHAAADPRDNATDLALDMFAAGVARGKAKARA